MEKGLPIGWVETELHVVSGILDNLRKPVNSTERGGRVGNIPYYGATGQAGWIDDYLFDEELVLVGEDGAPFFDKTKNVAYLINGKSWVNNHAHILKAISKILSNKFLLHFLNQFDYKDFVGGTTRLKLTQGDLKIIPVPLPPLPEQQRIVAKLDTLFGHLDTLKTRLDRIPQLLKDFRQKVLTQAVTGKLTEEWREGRELEDIRSLIPITDYVEDDRNGWIQTRVSNISKTISGYAFESSCFVETGIPLIRMGNLYQDKLDLNRNPVFIPSNYDERIVEKFSAKAGSILLSLTGTKYKRDYGYAIMIPEHKDRLLVNQRILNLEPKINNYFFLYLLRSDLFRDQFFSFETGGVNQGNVGSKGVESIALAIPSREEQQEIVHRVESLFAKANQIEAGYQKLKAKIEQLPQALLAKAFRGELVQQLPTDGDARELLGQIKQAKAGLEKGGKSRKMKEDGEVRMVAEEEMKYGK